MIHSLLQDSLKWKVQNKQLQRILRNGMLRFLPDLAEMTPSTNLQSYQTKTEDTSCVSGQRIEKWNQHFAFATNIYAVNTVV